MIITLCGSARFEKEFKHWDEKLTLAGHVVFSLAVYPSDKGKKEWFTPEEKEMLDRVHKRKINASGMVLVVDRALGSGDPSYIGESTKSEIDHARRRGIPVRWSHGWGSEVPEDLMREVRS